MPDIIFPPDDKIVLPTKFHGEVTLSKGKWGTICAQPERYYYRLNGEKIATTLINPDMVRHHKHFDNQFLYYKQFSKIIVADGVAASPPNDIIYFAVIVDDATKKVCTVYPVDRPKAGKEFKPKST